MAQLAKTDDKTNLPAEANWEDELFQDAGSGLEGIRSDDLAIPFLGIIQSNSPQRKKSDGAYIQGADEGMVFNNVTNELFKEDEGVWLIPAHFESKMVHWRPREEGGGFLGTYDPDDPILKDTTRDGAKEKLADGTYFVKTSQFYCIQVYPDGNYKRVVLPMASTQLKKSRRWNTMMMEQTRVHPKTGRRFTPPSFATKYHLATQPEENDRGSWYGWRILEAKPLDLEQEYDLYQAAKQFKESITKGDVQTSTPPPEDDEIPF